MTIHRIRLSKMQKIINVLAIASTVVSTAVVGSGIYVYVGGLGGVGTGSALPLGSNDLSPQTNPQATPQASLPEAPVQF